MAEVISVVGVVDVVGVVYLVHSWPCSFIQFIRCSCAQEVKEQWELEVAQVLGISWNLDCDRLWSTESTEHFCLSGFITYISDINYIKKYEVLLFHNLLCWIS
jgi:hypothetical protein